MFGLWSGDICFRLFRNFYPTTPADVAFILAKPFPEVTSPSGFPGCSIVMKPSRYPPNIQSARENVHVALPMYWCEIQIGKKNEPDLTIP